VLDAHGIVMEVQQHMAVVLIPIMLSTWIRNLKYLVPVSSIANFLIMAGYIATMYIMSHDVPSIHERRYVADWNNLPLFFGTVIYSFEGITLVSTFRHLIRDQRDGNINVIDGLSAFA
jgi:proton-coupled amino acid transporter